MARGEGIPSDPLPDDSAEELYEEAPCGYLSTLPGGDIVRVNGTFLDWTGYAREELVGRRRFQDLLTGGGRIYHETHFAPLLTMHGEAREIALDIVCASGARLPALVTSVLKRDGEGRPQLVRTTVFDARDRRRYEQELLAARDAERAARERADALARENARLFEQQRDVARVLQRSLLAGGPPSDDRFAVATYYRPAVETLEVGGDWHDCFAVGEDRVAVVVGDVVGRGIEAAAAMGQLRSAIRALAGARLSPGALLDRLDVFAEQLEATRYATVAYAEIALDTGATEYACAGHPPPLLLEPGEAPVALWDGRSPPLAANRAGARRPHGEVTLAPAARLLLYTDGLVERRTEPIDRGLDRLAGAFGAGREAELPALVGHLTDALLADFSGGDDVCLLCFERRTADGEGGAATAPDVEARLLQCA
jgi:sigma-B regulation protein RsbU (phosphoserine phosphatase)